MNYLNPFYNAQRSTWLKLLHIIETVGICFQCNISHLIINRYKNVFFAFQTWNKAKHKAFLINSQNIISIWICLDLMKDGYRTSCIFILLTSHLKCKKWVCVCVSMCVFNISRTTSPYMHFLQILLPTLKHPDDVIFSLFFFDWFPPLLCWENTRKILNFLHGLLSVSFFEPLFNSQCCIIWVIRSWTWKS